MHIFHWITLDFNSFLTTEEDSFKEHCMRASISCEFPEGRFHIRFSSALQCVWNQLRPFPVNSTHELYFSAYFIFCLSDAFYPSKQLFL